MFGCVIVLETVTLLTTQLVSVCRAGLVFTSASTSGVPAAVEALSCDWHKAVGRIYIPHLATAPASRVAITACLAAHCAFSSRALP